MRWFYAASAPKTGEAILAYYPFTYQPYAVVAWDETFAVWADPITGFSRIGEFVRWAPLEAPATEETTR